MRSAVAGAVHMRATGGNAIKNPPDTLERWKSGALIVCAARRAAELPAGMAGAAISASRRRRLVDLTSSKINDLLDLASARRKTTRRKACDVNSLAVIPTDCKSVRAARSPPWGGFCPARPPGGHPPKSPALKFRGVPPHRFSLRDIVGAANARTRILIGGGGVGGCVPSMVSP